MVMDLSRAARAIALTVLIGSLACDINSPERYPRAPVIESYQPHILLLTVAVGDSVDFSVTASDPDAQPLSYTYALDKGVVAHVASWRYIVDDTGPVTVTARASDGSLSSSVEWQLLRQSLPPPPPPPDTIPPAPVTIVSVDTGEPGPNYLELIVWWTAVGDDSTEGRPARYDVRYSDEPLASEAAWQRAQQALFEPDPWNPGALQFMVIRVSTWIGLKWVGVRAVDESGNISPLGNTLAAENQPREVFGTVGDAATDEPLPGIRVATSGFHGVTEPDGTYLTLAVPNREISFSITDDFGMGGIGDYFDISASIWVSGGEATDFWLLPNLPMETNHYPNFLTWFRQMSNTMNEPPNPLADNRLRTWDTPVSVFVPAFVSNGLDYQETVKNVFLRWETWLGRDLFEFVGSLPDIGVSILYFSGATREHYDVYERDADWFPVKGRIWLRTIWGDDTVGSFQRILAHEVGHALGMGHSTDPDHLMIGGISQRVAEPTPDEIWLGRAMYTLPRGTPLEWYRWE
ncbi:MAG: matrixin family metalloprotease [Candidatus Krumholzibacteria bacterium]|nr:matrixin family metalloprotease [Candidatus Krumholzibacteria bacterium]